jgi:hypothetical protein
MRSSHDCCDPGVLPLKAHYVKPRSRFEKSGGSWKQPHWVTASVVFPFDRTHRRLNCFDSRLTVDVKPVILIPD